MKRYKVRINYSGELHTFYTYAVSEAKALYNSVKKLSVILGINYSKLKNHVNNGYDNYKVKEV